MVDLVEFLRDPAVTNLIAILALVGGVLAWLFRTYRKPKLEVSLEPVQTYPDPEYAIPEQSPRKFKSQALRLKAKYRPIHQCKAKMVIDNDVDYLLWNPKSAEEGKNFVPQEEIELLVWQAVAMLDKATFYLNIRNKAHVDIKSLRDPITVEITFLSEHGLLNKKPYRYKIEGDSWDTVKMVSI